MTIISTTPIRIKGTVFDDVIKGDLLGDNVIAGRAGHDIILGRGGRDFLLGNAGDDFLFGGAGKDVLMGGRGNDQLFGGLGDDRLSGDFGDDFLRGGQGNDVFVFNGRINDGSVDTIADFRDGFDIIELANMASRTVTFAQDDKDVVITVSDANSNMLQTIIVGHSDLAEVQSATVFI